MKKIFLLIITFFAFANVNSQILNPVKWTSEVIVVSETEFDLVISGKIDADWHVYSQFTPDGGSLPMMLEFENSKGNFELIGKATESPYKKAFNDVFEVDEYYFEKSVTVTQRIRSINPNFDKIKLTLDYQVCKESCINDKKTFTFLIPTSKTAANGLVKISNSDSIKADETAVKSPLINDTVKKKSTR